MKYQRAWKVVRKDGKKLVSATRSGAGQINYSQRGWVKPSLSDNPFLWVFKRRQNARNFLAAQEFPKDYRIIRVKIKNPSDSWMTKLAFYRADMQPEGTIFCSELRVIRSKKQIYLYKVASSKFRWAF